MKPDLLLVTGGRDVTPTPWEVARFASLVVELGATRILHGACPTGVDAWVDAWAKENGLEPVPVPAEWASYGKAAGPIRNQVMVDRCQAEGGEAAVFRGNSGTNDCLQRAQAAGVPIHPVEQTRPQVLNRHHFRGKTFPVPFVYIGRGTPLGNEVSSRETHSEEEAMSLYKAWLWDRLKSRDQRVLGALRAITPLHHLVCSCAPRACHGDVVVAAWLWLREKTILSGPESPRSKK